MSANVVGLAKPILRVAGQSIVRILLEESRKRALGALVVGLTEQIEGVVVLRLRRPGLRSGRQVALGDRAQGFRAGVPGPLRGARLGAGATLGLGRLIGRPAFERLQAQVDVDHEVVEPLRHLIDAEGLFLDLAGQRPELAFELRETDLDPRRLGARQLLAAARSIGGRRRFAAIDMALQGVQIALQTFDLVEQALHAGVLGAGRRRRKRHGDGHHQHRRGR